MQVICVTQDQLRTLLQQQQNTQVQIRSTQDNINTNLVQSQPVSFKCELCNKEFTTDHGRSIHLSSCRKKHSAANPVAAEQPPTLTLSQPAINHQQSQREIQTPDPQTYTPIWGKLSFEDVMQTINSIYDEIVFWRKNVFLLPSGAAGKSYIVEMNNLIEAWISDSTPKKNFALKAVMIMPALLLQKPSFKSKAKDHSDCLKRRMNSWREGDFDKLLSEARAIQSKLQPFKKRSDPEHLAKTFAKLMLQGKVNAALKLLDNSNGSGVLPLSPETIKIYNKNILFRVLLMNQC